MMVMEPHAWAKFTFFRPSYGVHCCGHNKIGDNKMKPRIASSSMQAAEPIQHHDIVDDKTIHFPDTLSHCVFEQALGGGTRSTFLLRDMTTNKKFVLKLAAHAEAIKMEMLFNAIYHVLGVPVPNIHVYYSIPKKIQEQIGIEISDGYFQLAEYITSENNLSMTIDQAKKDYIVYALLGNTDVKPANFINEKLIDAGSNFMYRGLGEGRYELSHTLTELWGLKNKTINPIGSEWFQDIDYASMQEKALVILNKSYSIERTVNEKASLLGISDSLQTVLLDKFSERLDILIRYFFANQHTRAKPRIRASRQTGAGTLVYKIENGKVFILLLQRAKHRWWGNLGGHSTDEDYDVIATSKRETEEESNRQLCYSTYQLNTATSHDLIKIVQDGSYFLYRLSFMEDPGINLDAVKDSEHIARAYVPLENIIRGLKGPTIKEEDIETCTVENKSGEKIILYPPLYQMLTQPAVQHDLCQLLENKLLPGKHTQSLIRENIQPSRGPGSVNKIHHYLASSEEKTEQEIETLIKHADLLCELKDNVAGAGAISTSISTTLSQNEQHLKLLLGSAYTANNSRKNIIAFSKDKSFFVQLTPLKQKYFVETISRFLRNERLGGNTYFFIYHGCNDKASFLYLLYSKLYHYLFIQNGDVLFRINNKYISRFRDLANFITYFTNVNTGIFDINETSGNESFVAGNPFIFGNWDSANSFSLKYSIDNYTTIAVAIHAILTDLLAPFHIDATIISALSELFINEFANFGGALYQLQLSKEEIEKFCYAAKNQGNLNPHHQSLNLADILTQFMQADIGTMDEETKKYYKALQARLVLTSIQAFKGECVYWNEPTYEARHSAQQKLDKLAKKIVAEILKNSNKFSSDAISLTTPLVRLTSLWQKQTKPMDAKTEMRNVILNAIYQGDTKEFTRLFNNKPKNYSFYDEDDFTRNTIFTFLLKNNAFTFDDISQYLGNNWWSHFDFKTYNQYACLLSKINDRGQFLRMKEAISFAITSLSKYHFMTLYPNVNRYLLKALIRITTDQIDLEVDLAIIQLSKSVYDVICYNGLARTLDYIFLQKKRNYTESEYITLCDQLNASRSNCHLLSLILNTEQLSDKVRLYALKLVITTFDRYQYSIDDWINKGVYSLDIVDSHNNNLLHLMLYARTDVNKKLFSDTLTTDREYFYKMNNAGETPIKLLAHKYLESDRDTGSSNNELFWNWLSLLAQDKNHAAIHQSIAKLAASKHNKDLFQLFTNLTTLSTKERIEFFQQANGDGKLLFVKCIAEENIPLDQALSALIVKNISLMRIFDTFDTAQLKTIIQYTMQPDEITPFINLFRQVIGKKLPISMLFPLTEYLDSGNVEDNLILTEFFNIQKKISPKPADQFKIDEARMVTKYVNNGTRQIRSTVEIDDNTRTLFLSKLDSIEQHFTEQTIKITETDGEHRLSNIMC